MPKQNRSASNCPYVLTVPMKVWKIPQTTIVNGIQRDGRNFCISAWMVNTVEDTAVTFKTRLLGTSNATYETKKTTISTPQASMLSTHSSRCSSTGAS